MSGISNNEIKYLRSLSQKKFRDESGVFVVEGEKMVAEALKSGFEVEKVWREEEIGTDVMARITSLSSPSPALAVVKKPGNVRLSDGKAVSEALGLRGLFLALDTIRDPGNLGTIIRIADWFGIDGIFAKPCRVVQSEGGTGNYGRYFPCPLSLLRPPTACRCSRVCRWQTIRDLSRWAEHL